jgi:hypothetical protein
MSTLSVKPWIGEQFAASRLLVLGESTYSWRNDKGELVHPSPQHPTDCVNCITADFYGEGLGFLRTVSRGITNEEHPQPDQLKAAWNRVAFTNYVPGSIGEAGSRPTEEQWERGRSEFGTLLDEVKPLRMIVLGREMWSKLPEAHIGEQSDAYTGNFDRYAIRLSTGELCWCQPLRHPSGGLGWGELAATVRAAQHH